MAFVNAPLANDWSNLRPIICRQLASASFRMDFDHKVAALDDEDLVVGDKEEKNWRGIVISLLVIGAILSSIIFAIVLCTPSKYFCQVLQQPETA